MFLKIKKQFRSKLGNSENFIDVLPKKLTVDFNHKPLYFDNRQNTLFKEVTIVNPEEIGKGNADWLINVPIGTKLETETDLLTEVKAILKNVIYRSWKNKDHFISCSSGFDTRTISLLIKELYDEHGKEWLGNTVFVCDIREEEKFLEIMKAEGWEENYYVFNDVKPELYYKRVFDNFDNAWKGVNNSSPIIYSAAREAYNWAVENEIVGKDCQHFTGQWANEVFESMSGTGMNWVYYVQLYGNILSSWDIGGDAVFPYTDVQLARTVKSSSCRLGADIRFKTLNFINPVVAKIRNDNARRFDEVPIDKTLLKATQDKYDKTWYGKKVRIKLPNVTKNNDTKWGYWYNASLCEHLLKEGYKLK